MGCYKLVTQARVILYVMAPLLIVGALASQSLPGIASGSNGGTKQRSFGPLSTLPQSEWESARKEFQALTDTTLECGPEEMPAYWRLLKWSVHQTVKELRRENFQRAVYNELVNMPNQLRGMPVQVDMHVCRILSYDAPNNSLGITKLYELWGWSEDSRGSLFVTFTPELPPGIHPGETVSEQVAVYGFFCKIQGYLAVGSAPQSFPSAAPLIIGRITPYQPVAAPVISTQELWYAAAGLVLVVSFAGTVARKSRFRNQQAAVIQRAEPNAVKFEAWLDQEETSPLECDKNAEDTSEDLVKLLAKS